MKSKAKPVKGSARTKRFDIGGTVGALAGLGTLAYLMSRKKKDAAGAESGGMSKDPNAPSVADRLKDKAENNDSKVVKPPPGVIFEEDRARDRALKQSKGQGNLVPEGLTEQDRNTLYQSDKALVRTDDGKAKPVVNKNANKPKPRIPPKASVGKSGQGSNTNTGVDAGIAEGNKKSKTTEATLNAVKTLKPGQSGYSGSGESRPYPEKEAAADKAAADKAAADKRDKVLSQIRNQTHKVGTGQKTDSNPLAFGPSNTFLTKERLDKSKEAMKEGRKMGLFERGYPMGKKKGGAVKKMASGGMAKSSASKRADGIAQRGKTRGKVC